MRDRWRAALGFALSAALLAWSLRDVRLAEVWLRLRQANIPLLLLSAATATATFPLRARRWRTLLEPVAGVLPFAPLWHATAVGMMVNNVVPARAGELARAFALTRETRRVTFSAAFASIAVDRVFDSVVLLALMLAAMLDPRFPREAVVAGQRIGSWVALAALVAAGVLVALYLVVFFPDWLIALFERFARRVVPALEARGRAALHAFAAGLGALRAPRRFAAVFGWTLAHWLVNALSLWIGFRALGIGAPFTAALLLQGIIAIGVAIPSSPGFFGVFEAFAVAGLALYGIPAGLAVSWAVGFHLLSFIPITVIGGVYATRLGVHLADVRAARAGAEGDVAPAEDNAPTAERDGRAGSGGRDTAERDPHAAGGDAP